MRRLAAIVLLTVVSVAGCSKGSGNDPQVASAQGSGATPTATASASGDADPVKFSQCMRDHGLTWFPDPDSSGRLSVNAPAGTDDEKFKKAQEACKQYDPAASGNGHKMSEADFEALRKVSQCMRDHGITGFPDPDPTAGGIRIDEKQLGGLKPGDPTFDKAQQECDKYAPAGPKEKSTNGQAG